jgi:mono/diheme cytochrome c family protein
VNHFLANRRPTRVRPDGALAGRLRRGPRVWHVLSLLGLITLAALMVGHTSAIAQAPRPAAQGGNASAGNIQNGKRIFASQNCNQCHGSEGQGGSAQVAGPRIGPPRLALPMFIEFVREPMNPMPPYSTKAVSDTELADVYAYLKSIPPSAQADTAPSGNAENGKRLYLSDGCYECHDREGQGGAGTGPRLAPNPIAFSAFARQVRLPVDQMPPYTSKVLPDGELADIYAFLQAVPKPPSPESIPLLK